MILNLPAILASNGDYLQVGDWLNQKKAWPWRPGREREREGDRDRERDRQRQRQTETRMEMGVGMEMKMETETETGKEERRANVWLF